MINYTYSNVMKEYADLNDEKTLNVLTTITEADQNKALINITNKLYDNIVEKVTDIDFGEIPKTRGDITKLPDYNKMIETTDLLASLLTEYKQNMAPVEVIQEAIANVEAKKNMFEMAFKTETELPIILYNTIVLSIVSAISLLISTSIEYIKQPSSDDFDIVVNKVAANKTKDSLLFSNLKKFNNSCKNGSFDKAMDHLIKSSSKELTGILVGFGFMQAAALAFVALSIIPMLRELIYFFYYSRVKVSDYFSAQADLLQMNAYNLERRQTGTDADKIEKVVKKQTAISSVFRKIANSIEVTSNKADKEAAKEISKVSKKYKADDIFEDEAPDSASALF